MQEENTTVTRPTICVTAPARVPVIETGSDIVDGEKLDRAYDALKTLGWRVKETQNVRTIHKGFAGDDASRIRGLEAAFADPEVDVVMAARGGYGTTRLLTRIDWKTLLDSSAVFVGLSDLTALNMALMRMGKASWQGPVITAFARDGVPCSEAFMQAMTSPSFDLTTSITGDSVRTEGVLWGGNLTMLVSLLGTPYFPKLEQIDGGILFVEDVNEPAWRIERMLNQLLLAGVLERQSLVIVGDMQGHERWQGKGNAAFTLTDALDYVRETARIPVVEGLRFGHVADTLTLPVGVNAQVKVADGNLVIHVAESPVPTEYPGAQTANAPLWWV